MSLFSALVKTVVNVATLPVAVVKDVITMAGVITDQEKPCDNKCGCGNVKQPKNDIKLDTDANEDLRHRGCV